MKDLILKHALINAVEHEGKAEKQAVLGKVLAENSEFKNKIKELLPEIEKVVNAVNSMLLEDQKRKIADLGIEIKKEKIKETLELPNVKKYKKVVMRLAPFPSGPLHIGNARMVILNDVFVKKYKGKLFVVIDDTIGSEEKTVLPESYEMIIDGLKWLGVKWNKLFYKSSRLKFFYKVAEELIKRDFAYVCECDTETLRKNRVEGKACEHRTNYTEDNFKKWKMMLKGKYKEGEAVVRLKTDIKHPNPAFRDRVLLRISERKHPLVGKKYKVWPLLEFSWAVDDHLLGITHILRGKELVIEDMMEEFIWEKLGWEKTEFIHYGLLKVEEFKLSKTAARIAIERGEYTGWDDPRTWSLQSLRRRGIKPEAIRNFILRLGLSQADVTVPAEILYSENRKIIDKEANRYFAVLNPIKIKIKDSPKIKFAEAPLHPDFSKRGKRKIPFKADKVYIEKEDYEKNVNKEVSLINLYSINLDKTATFTSKEVKYELQKIQWLSEPNVKIKIVMPNGSIKNGIAEPNIKNLKQGQIIQLVRIGFCSVDKIGKDIVLYFAHK